MTTDFGQSEIDRVMSTVRKEKADYERDARDHIDRNLKDGSDRVERVQDIMVHDVGDGVDNARRLLDSVLEPLNDFIDDKIWDTSSDYGDFEAVVKDALGVVREKPILGLDDLGKFGQSEIDRIMAEVKAENEAALEAAKEFTFGQDGEPAKQVADVTEVIEVIEQTPQVIQQKIYELTAKLQFEPLKLILDALVDDVAGRLENFIADAFGIEKGE